MPTYAQLEVREAELIDRFNATDDPAEAEQLEEALCVVQYAMMLAGVKEQPHA